MMLYVWVSYIIMMLGVAINSEHLLVCLLILDGGMLVVLMMVGMGVGIGLMSVLGLFMFSYVSVCEGVMGLALLVKMIEMSGGDKFYYYGII